MLLFILPYLALPKFLQATTYSDYYSVQEMHSLLPKWTPPSPIDALELLDSKFADPVVRLYLFLENQFVTPLFFGVTGETVCCKLFGTSWGRRIHGLSSSIGSSTQIRAFS